MKVFFTSDTHFGSQRTLELSKRPFKSVEEMDSVIIKNWNNVVDKNDTIYHLGDFGDHSRVSELNGKIILIQGNYEREDNLCEYELKCYGYKDVYTDEFVKIKVNDLELGLVHEPSNSLLGSKKTFHLFGHIHKLQMVKKFGLNVGTDCHNFTPIDLDTVLFYKNAIENFYDKEVFMY